jgi:hypothetical protein
MLHSTCDIFVQGPEVDRRISHNAYYSTIQSTIMDIHSHSHWILDIRILRNMHSHTIRQNAYSQDMHSHSIPEYAYLGNMHSHDMSKDAYFAHIQRIFLRRPVVI